MAKEMDISLHKKGNINEYQYLTFIKYSNITLTLLLIINILVSFVLYIKVNKIKMKKQLTIVK